MQVPGDFLENFAGGRKEIAGVMAEEARTKRLVGENKAEVEKYADLAKKALQAGNDGDAKVFIIPEASRMTPQAQNALLKVLEQPPDGVTFLLCDRRADGILETLRSRMVAFSLAEGFHVRFCSLKGGLNSA